MKITHQITFIISLQLLLACTATTAAKESIIRINNPKNGGYLAQSLSVDLPPLLTSENCIQASHGVLVEQVSDAKGNKHLQLIAKLPPGKTQDISLTPCSEAVVDLTYAELSVRTGGNWQGKAYTADGFDFKNVTEFVAPPQLTDHSYYLRYEGPGWENDLIGYRLYLDWRNAIDVFAKTNNNIVLPQVGQTGYDDYHLGADWGADVLKVGKSLGLGALGRMIGDTVMHFQDVEQTRWSLLQDNNLSASFAVEYLGWKVANDKVDLSTEYRINGRDPSTMVTVKLAKKIDNLVTGIVKHPAVKTYQKQAQRWGYIATFGKQSTLDEEDTLGLALFYQLDSVAEQIDGEFDHLIRFKPANRLQYQFLAVWPTQANSPKNAGEFSQFLEQKLRSLEQPISAELTH